MATERSVLFSWDDVEGLGLPELRRLGFVPEQLPDEGVVSALEARRGRGRNEYPARAMWRALVAGVVFGHESSASLLRELGRNPALLGVCGFDPLGRQAPPGRALARRSDGTAVAVEEPRPRRDGVPTPWAFSRFLRNVVDLEDRTGAVSGMVDALLGRLMAELPGCGRVVRIPLAGADRRAFTPTPWGSPSWKRGYARRGALERINARLDNSFGFERHFTRGRVRM